MNSSDLEEDGLAALLTEAGRRPQPPEATKQAWEALFRDELSRVVAARHRRRNAAYGAAAAVMLLVAGIVVLLGPAGQTPPPLAVAEVVTTSQGNRLFSAGANAALLTGGSTVYVDQTIRTASSGMLALAYRGADVRLNSDTTVVFHTASIELISGSIYVDTGGDMRKPAALPVVISTALGSFSHLGTQFMVTADDAKGVTAAVREGTIHLRTDRVQRNFNATAADAEIVKISRSGAIETQRIARHGGPWDWVVSSAPGRVINGLSAHEVLGWIARETGRELQYAPPELATVAAAATIGAPAEQMNPQQALKFLNAVTSLHVDDSASVDLLVTSSEGDHYPH